jgi:hypothetical protein
MINKNSKYLIIYFIAIIPILIIHYFLISKININSTLQVFVNLILFTFSLSLSSNIYDRIKKLKRKK